MQKEGGGYAEFDVSGSTEVSLDKIETGRIHLSIKTKSGNEIAVGVSLDDAAARDLGERLVAHSVLLESPEDD